MGSAIQASARVFRVRTDFVALGREMRVHVLCECGSGAWIAAIAPFPDLFFDERPLIGRSVGEGLAWLAKHYGGLRLLADILDPSGRRGGIAPAALKQEPDARPHVRPARRRPREGEGQGELPLPVHCHERPGSLSPRISPKSGGRGRNGRI
jgi:hypothetical protein